MEDHYICTGSCGAVITKQQYDEGLNKCGAPQGCSRKGNPFVKCAHCPKCDEHTPKKTAHTCVYEKISTIVSD